MRQKSANLPGLGPLLLFVFFAPTRSGTASSDNQAAPYVYVREIIWRNDDGEVVRDLIPCKKADGTVCMYDIVGQVFYENANTLTTHVEFVGGPEV